MAGRFENLFARVAVAVVAIPVIIWATMTGSYAFFVLVTIISSIALHEFYGLMEKKGAFPLKGLGLAAGVLVSITFVYERLQVELYQFALDAGFPLRMFSQLQLFLVVLVVFLLLTLLVELFRVKGSPSLNIATTLAGVLIISLCFGLLIRLRELFPYGFPVSQFMGSAFADDDQLGQIDRWGGFTVLSILAAIWVCDTAAYFVGSAWGKHKILPRVSPGKSWEGGVAGFLGSLAVLLVVKTFFLEYLSTTHAVVIGCLVGAFGQLGDFIESRFKRDSGVKDSSSIIPGHGGVYDRFDSLVFIAPIVYLYIDFIVLS